MKFLIVVCLLAMISHVNAVMINGKQVSMDQAIMMASDYTKMSDQIHGERTVKVEMDMIYDRDTYLEMLEKENKAEESTRKKRKAVRSKRKLWPKAVVPYEISSRMSRKDKKEIMAAIDNYQNYTCLKFRPARRRDKNKIRFRDAGDCSSWIGKRRKRRRQIVSLAPHCREKPIIIHEIGHAIGFYHEQTRLDRDDYVTIVKENIEPHLYHNYRKRLPEEMDMYSIPYDYTSIMHYSKNLWTSNGKPTMYTKDKSFQDVIGFAEELSFRDIQLANTMYDCAALNDCPSVTCPENSFQGPDCKCWCDSRTKTSPIKECKTQDATTKSPYADATTKSPRTYSICVDFDSKCQRWKDNGYCSADDYANFARYMSDNCPATCKFCNVLPCQDNTTNCEDLAERDLCHNEFYAPFAAQCPKSCKFCSEDENKTLIKKK